MEGETITREPIHWMGSIETKCQLSGRKLTTEFVDGRVPGMSSWAIMHPAWFKSRGGKLGTGRGQRYQKQPNGRWLKVEG
jgi:hypothetical protein